MDDRPEAGGAAACLACSAPDAVLWATATDGEYRTTADLFRYLRCRRCDALFIDPVPRDRLAAIYPPNYYSFADPGQSWVQRIKRRLDARLFRRLLGQLPGDTLSVLDVGGGAGWELSWLRELDTRVRATQIVDLDPGAEQAARRSGHEYFCGRIEDYETERRFDFILLLSIIEHVEDPGAVLRKMRRLLTPGGVALIKTPNTDSLDARLFRHRNWAGYHCPRHWVLFTRESFRRLAERCGLNVREFAYTQGAPFWAGSILFGLFPRAITADRPVHRHPLFGPLSAAFAASDLLRKPLSKPSQMFFTLGRSELP